MLTLLLLTFVSHAQDLPCRETHRLDSPGQSFAKLPTYDQNKGEPRGQDICYAITASLLADDYRLRHGDPLDQLSSPLSMALNHKAAVATIDPYATALYGQDQGESLGPGNPVLALVTNAQRPVCDQRFLESSASTMITTPESKTVSLHTFLNETIDQINLVELQKQVLASNLSAVNAFYKCRVSAGATSLKDVVSASRYALTATEPILKVQRFLQRFCQGHDHKLNLPLPTSQNSGDFAATINELLKRSTPIGVNYCGETLLGKTCRTADHTSVIIGQRLLNGHCEYLMRDSVVTKGENWLRDDQLRASADLLYWLP